MATTPESKIDAAAAKAYAEAAAKQVEAPKAEVAPVVLPAATPAPAKKAAAEVAPKAAVVKKPTTKKVATKKVAAKKPAAKKPVARKVAATAPATETVTATAPERAIHLKDTIMTKAKTTAADYTAQLKEGLATVQEHAKAAYDKGAELAAEVGEFSKGNLEAVVESGKIFAAGVQTIAKTQFEDAKAAMEVMTADLKEMAAVKSPTEFVQLQGKLVSRNFDAAVAQLSKTTEAWVKLANDSFAPISSRAAVAMEMVRKAA